MLRRAGLFQSAGLLYRARRAYQALRHHPRRAVRRPYVQEPFCVINADDYYGVDAYRAIYRSWAACRSRERPPWWVICCATPVSAHGTVSRGVCQVENGHLTGIHEALKIQLFPDGSIADVADGQRRELAADMPVSMNFWGFMPSIFDQMEEYLDDFLRTLPPEEIKAEVPAAQHGGRSAEKRDGCPCPCCIRRTGGSV